MRRAIFAALAITIAAPAVAADTGSGIALTMDEVRTLTFAKPIATIYVGNPSIADVSVQSGKVLIVTGKSFGETNLMVIDADGKMIINRRLIVQEPRAGFVTVYRGSARQTLHCAPYCAPELMIGDATDVFSSVSGQITTKESISQTAAEGEKP